MKTIIFIFLSIFICHQLVEAQTAAEVEAFRKMKEACITEQKLSADDAKIIKGGLDNLNTNPSKSLKCYFQCLYKQMKLVDDSGKPNIDMIMKYMATQHKGQPDKLKKVLTGCTQSMNGSDQCENVFNFENCVLKAMKA